MLNLIVFVSQASFKWYVKRWISLRFSFNLAEEYPAILFLFLEIIIYGIKRFIYVLWLKPSHLNNFLLDHFCGSSRTKSHECINLSKTRPGYCYDHNSNWIRCKMIVWTNGYLITITFLFLFLFPFLSFITYGNL